jgi:hypothetical protein
MHCLTIANLSSRESCIALVFALQPYAGRFGVWVRRPAAVVRLPECAPLYFLHSTTCRARTLRTHPNPLTATYTPHIRLKTLG